MKDNYIWAWKTRVRQQGPKGPLKASFDQSTFFAESPNPPHVSEEEASVVPTLNEKGEIDRLVLDLMHTKMRLGKIADTIIQQFPHVFSNREKALWHVRDLSRRYGG